MPHEPSFIQRLIRTQRFTLGTPRTFRVAGEQVYFLRSADGWGDRHHLWCLDLPSGTESLVVDTTALRTGPEQLSADERTRRERSRQTGAGMLRYALDAAGTIAAFTYSEALFTVDLATLEVVEHPSAGAHAAPADPSPNPQGTHVAYVSGASLRAITLATGEDTELIAEPAEQVSWGSAEFIAAEELGRPDGYWWSPGGQYLLVQRSDSSPVDEWTIADPAHPEAPARTVRYPAAGTGNVDVSLALVGLDGSFVPVESGPWEYLTAVSWSEGGPPLLTVQSRDQRRLDVLALDVTDGSTTPVHTELDADWVELVAGVPAWSGDGRLVRVGVSAGAYRLLIDGRAVTEPGMQVRSVLHVGSEVLFSASEEDPTQIHLYRTEGDSVRRLSEGPGVHAGAGTAEVAVCVTWSLQRSGPLVRVQRPGRDDVAIDAHPADPGLAPNVSLHTVTEDALRVALVLPSWYRDDHGPLPVLLDPYGGPHAQRVLATRAAYLSAQWFADHGFAVLITDGRGTPGRGPAWEKSVARDLAGVTLEDQLRALEAVAGHDPRLDTGHVGIRGWSFGGYLAALAVLRRPDAVHAAVAGAPVVDWSLYDTHYTERYLGRPEVDEQTYRQNSLLADAGALRRPLLLVHGLADDNVFVAHSLRLSAALQAAGREHTFLPLVGVTHMIPQDAEAAEHLLSMQVRWLRRSLGLAEQRQTPEAQPETEVTDGR